MLVLTGNKHQAEALQGAPGSDCAVGAVVPLLSAWLEDGTVVVARMSLAGQCGAAWVGHGSL